MRPGLVGKADGPGANFHERESSVRAKQILPVPFLVDHFGKPHDNKHIAPVNHAVQNLFC
jgi:hypothetical protein